MNLTFTNSKLTSKRVVSSLLFLQINPTIIVLDSFPFGWEDIKVNFIVLAFNNPKLY